jgi:DNA polymerase III alpha subunit
MRLNNLGEAIFNDSDLFCEIYKGNITKIPLSTVDVSDDIIKYLTYVNENFLNDWPVPNIYIDNITDQTEFDKINQNNWFIPQGCKHVDIEEYLLSLCVTEKEKLRVIEELALYNQKNLIPILIFLKYLVSIFRDNNIVWGVGRGSSVASYCLYLLGIHKIDSIKYNLDIREFIR